tara:strand:+ start:692 stop:2155 length:1464 start_codon:yes stop_codon:yes gene_type:complete
MKTSNIKDFYNKGQELIKKNRLDDALNIFLELSKKDKKSSNILLTIAQIYIKKNNLINSKIYLKKAIKMNPNNEVALNNLANIYSKKNNIKEAIKYYQKSSNINPKYSTPVFNLATIYEQMGKLDEAKKFYLKSIKLDNLKFEYYYNLNRIEDNIIKDSDVEFIKQQLKSNQNLTDISKSNGYFILAAKERYKKNINEEFEFLSKGHQYFYQSNANNKLIKKYWLETIPKILKNVKLTGSKKTNNNLSPIFVIGLPRSGTTLVESIIFSASKGIINGGETAIINKALTNIKGKQLFNIKDFNSGFEINIDEYEKEAIRLYEDSNLNENIFIDKSLENIFFAELIFSIFPNSKIINCQRNKFDNLIAIYQQFFSQLAWSHSLENIIKYINNHNTFLSINKKKFPDKILSVDLEELTNDPINTSQKILSFCNLDWSEKVLDFHKREDLISKTASNIQIRKQIYKYDKKRFEQYRYYFKDSSLPLKNLDL